MADYQIHFSGPETDELLQIANQIIKEEFSSSSTYDAGDLVTRNSILYRCIDPIVTPGEWDASKWQITTVSDAIKNNINDTILTAINAEY